MPGGGSNLDLIDAAGRAGLPFVLTATETAGALAAIAQAEIAGRPAACLTTLGPGVASVVNGVACAQLDRAPLLVFTDSHPSSAGGRFEHQRGPGSWTRCTPGKGSTAGDGRRPEVSVCLTPGLSRPAGHRPAIVRPGRGRGGLRQARRTGDSAGRRPLGSILRCANMAPRRRPVTVPLPVRGGSAPRWRNW